MWSLIVLRNKVRGFDVGALLGAVGKMILAAVVMAEVVWLLTHNRGEPFGSDGLMRLLIGLVVGPAVYFGLLLVLDSPDVKAGMRLLRRRRSA